MVLPLLLALSVTASDAICAVRGWTRQGGTLTVIGAPVKADRFETSAGNAFYAVKTSEGTVFTAADTDYDPIIAFTSAVADFSEIDPASPLWALMTRSVDFACYNPDAFARWQELLAAGSWRRTLLAASQGIADIGDVRVDPLTTSKWGQGTNGKRGCYNYYTPGYSVCGCVATAMAQVMYHHRYPASVDETTKKCSYNGTDNVKEYTITPGAYEWDSMVDDPKNGIDEAGRKAIGKLTYDCGVAAHMHWNFQTGYSGTFDDYAEAAFYETFGYKSATVARLNGMNQLASAANLQGAILSNLDAGYPVMIGISDSNNSWIGHSLVVDGYGYDAEKLYIHLNLGWDGSSEDMWYNIPKLGTKSYNFNQLDDVVYNIIPGDTVKATFSGRVTNEYGQAVANLPLAIYNGNNLVTNLVTNPHGVFGFASTPFRNYKVVVAECADYLAATNENRTLSLPVVQVYDGGGVDQNINEIVYIYRYVDDAYNIGNSWGNNLGLKANTKTDQSVTASAESAGGASVDIPLNWFIDEGLAAGTTPVSAMSAMTSALAANGLNSVAECYVIGISPTNETAQFTASISFDAAGNPQIDYDPNLVSARTYRKLCSDDLKSWREWNGVEAANFFKVEVSK